MEVERGDLVQENCHDGITFGIVQRLIIDDRNPGLIQLCTPQNPNLIWCTYERVLKFNYGKMTLEEVIKKYPERLI